MQFETHPYPTHFLVEKNNSATLEEIEQCY